jgi:Holliday junction resolvase RusA-like endonuclease
MLKLTLPLPPSLNHYLVRGKHGVYQSSDAIAYKTQVGYATNYLTPMEGELVVELRIYGSRQDVDNTPKLIFDSLNKRAWLDDSQITELHIYKHKAKKRDQRVELTAWLK